MPISFTPSEEQQMIVNTVRQFATDEMREAYRDCEESGEIPDDLVNTAWELGLVATGVPEDLGGAGGDLSALTNSLAAEELAWGDLAIAMKILCPALVAFPLIEMGTDEQKKAYLPAFCDDTYKPATAALMEPRFDFDPNDLSTTAKLDGGDYVLNGEKCYVPMAAEADLTLVYARENGGVQGFLVEKGAKGLEIGEREKNMGIKALPTYELALKDCRVPKANRLGGDAGCDYGRILNRCRVGLSAMAVGVGRASFEYARDYAKDRLAFGEPIASRQAIAFMIAENAIEVDAMRMMTWEAAWKVDRKEDATKEASLTKMYADDMVLMITDRGVQVLGGHGYIREHPVELWLRNGRGFATFHGMAIV